MDDLPVIPRETDRSRSARRQLLNFPQAGDRVALEGNCAYRYGSFVIGVHRVAEEVVVQFRVEYSNSQQISAQGQRIERETPSSTRVHARPAQHSCSVLGASEQTGDIQAQAEGTDGGGRAGRNGQCLYAYDAYDAYDAYEVTNATRCTPK